jgi:hypothetical protein
MGSNSTGGGFEFEPSTPLCVGLSALGGLIEVASTMCLAYPEHRAKMGHEYGPRLQQLLLLVNLALMGIASVCYIVGSWFGPVSLSVPTVMVAKLHAACGSNALCCLPGADAALALPTGSSTCSSSAPCSK